MSDKKAYCGCGAVFYVPHWEYGSRKCPACVRAEKADEAAYQRERVRSAKEAEAARERLFNKLADKFEEERQKAKDAWYSRECPNCAEIVKRKAKVCKECGHKFEDWEEQRKDIEHWEERGAKVGVDAWNQSGIEQAEYKASPEGQAEQRRKEEEEKRKKEEEKAAREEDRRIRQAKLDEQKRQEAAAAQQKQLLSCLGWILFAILVFAFQFG